MDSSDRVTSPAGYLRIDLDIVDEATPNIYTLPTPRLPRPGPPLPRKALVNPPDPPYSSRRAFSKRSNQ